MDGYKERVARAAELVKQRDDIDNELKTIFGEITTPPPQQRKCGHCGEPGHQKRTCPQLSQ